MGLRDFLLPNPVWRRKAATASPEVLETMAAGRFTAFPLIAMPNRGDQMRAAFEAMVSSTYGDMYRTQPSVRSVVDFLARNVAQLALRLYERTSDIERHEASSHPAAETMRHPNKGTPGQKFIFDLVRDHLVYGNAYAFKSRVRADAPLVLTQLPPARTSVLGPSYFTIDAYRVYRVDGSHFDEPPENIFHWPGATNPNDPRLGLSPLETLRQVLAEDAASQSANVELLKSGLVKSGYIQRPLDAPEWNDEGMNRFREAWMNAVKDSTRKTPVLEEGMTFEDFGVSPKDAQMLDGRRFTIEEVCRVYGVPKGLIGVSEAGSNLASEHEQFLTDVLPPICEMLCAYLGLSVLQQEYDAAKHYFEFDLDEKLQGDERLKALVSVAGAPVMTRNEARRKLNLPPKEDGDDLVTPLNVTVGGKPSPAVMPVQDPNAPPQDGSHRTASEEIRALENGNRAVLGNGKAFLLAKREGQRQRRERYAAEFTAELRKFFTSQERSERTKADKAFDLERWVKELKAILLKLMRSSVEREGTIAAAGMGSAFDMALVKHYLEETAKGKAEEINAATRDALFTGDFADVFAEAKDIRAQGTGGTLATKMSAFAQTEAAKQTPDVENRIKTWVVNDLETSLHPEMDGETVPLAGRFSNGKEYPPYEHPGCQCMVAVT